jgi:hypothetical protein
VKPSVHLGRARRLGLLEPPAQQAEKGGGGRLRLDREGERVRARPTRHQPALDRERERRGPHLVETIEHPRPHEGLVEGARGPDVLEQLGDGGEAGVLRPRRTRQAIQVQEQVAEAREEEIVLAAIVGVEGRSPEVRVVEQLLDGEAVVALARCELGEGPSERPPRALGASIAGRGRLVGAGILNSRGLSVHYRTEKGDLVVVADAGSSQAPRMNKLPRDPYDAALLLTSAALTVLLMAFHPTGHELLEAGPRSAEPQVNPWVHGIAILALSLLLTGLLGLVRRLETPRLGLAAAVAYGVGTMAFLLAATASGWVTPRALARLAEASGSSRELYAALAGQAAELNQATAKIGTVATSAAIALLGLALLGRGRFARGLGIVGIGLGLATALAVVTGQLRLDVHGFGLVVVGQSAWWAGLGVALLGRRAGPPPERARRSEENREKG